MTGWLEYFVDGLTTQLAEVKQGGLLVSEGATNQLLHRLKG
ncbi:MAG TPA: hypothetical protein VM163_12620 [bacterium]|nr:hypothetical protein [bacterium]